MVVYLNQILGLTDNTVQTYLPKKCITVREEVKGVVQPVEKCFLLYSYGYNRAENFAALPDPKYIPSSGPEDGVFEYLGLYDTDPLLLFQIVQGPITSTVFGMQSGLPGWQDRRLYPGGRRCPCGHRVHAQQPAAAWLRDSVDLRSLWRDPL